MKPPSSSAPPTRKASTTGSHRRMRCISDTDSNPASDEALVASRIGRNTRVGSCAPCCRRYTKMVTGNSVSDEAFITRNRICALLAVSSLGLSVCSSRIARRPIGVAALSRPSTLAAKFRQIRPIAGCPAGTSGIRRRNSGPSHARQRVDQAGAFGDLQEPQPQRQRAEQQQHDLHRQLGHVEQAVDHGRPHVGMPADQPAGQPGDRRDQEEAEPQAVQHGAAITRSGHGRVMPALWSSGGARATRTWSRRAR